MENWGQKTKLTSNLQSKARTEESDQDTEVEYGQKHENNSSLVFASCAWNKRDKADFYFPPSSSSSDWFAEVTESVAEPIITVEHAQANNEDVMELNMDVAMAILIKTSQYKHNLKLRQEPNLEDNDY